MQRTTIVADEQLLERLRTIARREQISLAEVIRQGLELRASQPAGRLHFIGVGESTGERRDTGRRAGELSYEPRSWR